MGVLQWLLYATGATDAYRAVFHATALIQGLETCLAAGFLFTFVPRRTGGAPPARWEMAAAAAGPVAATLAAWWERWAIAQTLWMAGIAVVALFVVRRVLARGGRERVPPVFLWVPVALVAGAGGAAAVAVAAVLGPAQEPELWLLGRGVLLQGMVGALVVGVGGTMLPTLTRGTPPMAGPGGSWERLGQTAAALIFLASFFLEVYAAPRLGLALRALVSGGTLVASARLWRPPSIPGLHRRLIWLAAWLMPAGFAAAAVAPSVRSAALHVVFIGCFALLSFSVSLHVAVSHGGRPERLAGNPWRVIALGTLLLAAAAFRVTAGLDPSHLKLWLGCAAACFLMATGAWAALVLPAARAAGSRHP